MHHLVHLETLVGDAGVVAVHREAKLHQGLRQLGLVSHLVGKCAVMNSMTGTESNRSFLTNLKLWKSNYVTSVLYSSLLMTSQFFFPQVYLQFWKGIPLIGSADRGHCTMYRRIYRHNP